jgi:adenylosuccinate synthase
MRLLQLDISRSDFADTEQVKLFFDILAMRPGVVAEQLMHHGELMKLVDPKDLLKDHDTLVVEGAQGLMLDEFLGDFPHVTRSITGLASSIRVAAECGKTEITPIYMTRTYLTRHGAGPLPFAGIEISDKDIPVDQTNVLNDWQGAIRNSPLQLKELKWYIEADLQRATFASQIFGVTVKTPQLFITCMDQIGEVVNVIDRKGKLHMVTKEFLPDYIEEELGIKVGFLSYGPTAADVKVR